MVSGVLEELRDIKGRLVLLEVRFDAMGKAGGLPSRPQLEGER